MVRGVGRRVLTRYTSAGVRCWSASCRHAEARKQIEDSLAVLDRLLKPHHPWSASRYLVLGQIELATDHPRSALAYLEQARAVTDASDGSVARTLADVDFETARALAALGVEPERADALARSARDRYARYPELGSRRQQIDTWLAQPAGRSPACRYGRASYRYAGSR
jgi:hypothetical protein